MGSPRRSFARRVRRALDVLRPPEAPRPVLAPPPPDAPHVEPPIRPRGDGGAVLPALPARRVDDLGDGLRSAVDLLALPAFLVLLVAGAAVIGAGAVVAPLAALGIVLVAVAAAVLLTVPQAVLLVALAAFVWQPQSFLGGPFAEYPQVQKALVLAAGVVFAARHGIDRRMALPLLAYPVLTVLSYLGGSPAPGLTPGQTVTSFITLTVAWLLFAVRWEWERDQWVLRLLALLPVVCVPLGVLLDAANLFPSFSHSPPRLGGALIAPFLAATTLTALAATVVLHRRGSWRWAGTLIVVNSIVLLATVTRGAIIAGVLLMAPVMWRFLVGTLPSRAPRDAVRLVALVLLVVGVAALAVPAVQGRDQQTIFVPGQGEVRGDASSGRFGAWSYAYKQASENLVFGRGMGAGPVIGSGYQSFLAQHNEYLRMLLEGGYVGGGVVLLAIIATFVRAIRRAPRDVRPELIGFALGIALYSATDNTLTSTQFSAGMAVAFAIGSAASSSRPDSPARRGAQGQRAHPRRLEGEPGRAAVPA